MEPWMVLLAIVILIAIGMAGSTIYKVFHPEIKGETRTNILKQLGQAPKLQLRAIYFAGPAISAMMAALVWVIIYGNNWQVTYQGKQLDFLGYTLWALTGILALVVIALCAGLVSSLSISVGALKANVNLDDDKSPGSSDGDAT